jgi:thiol-disulfide isomerase/thioredoxin
VLIDFWTYTCINSLRPLPYVRAWAAKYKDDGLVVIGVHTPEFSFEHEPVNVQNAARNLDIAFPVTIDSNYKIWQSFNNQYWPAQYLVDAKGRIRYHHFGEEDYDEIEHISCGIWTRVSCLRCSR